MTLTYFSLFQSPLTASGVTWVGGTAGDYWVNVANNLIAGQPTGTDLLVETDGNSASQITIPYGSQPVSLRLRFRWIEFLGTGANVTIQISDTEIPLTLATVGVVSLPDVTLASGQSVGVTTLPAVTLASGQSVSVANASLDVNSTIVSAGGTPSAGLTGSLACVNSTLPTALGTIATNGAGSTKKWEVVYMAFEITGLPATTNPAFLLVSALNSPFRILAVAVKSATADTTEYVSFSEGPSGATNFGSTTGYVTVNVSPRILILPGDDVEIWQQGTAAGATLKYYAMIYETPL